MKALQKQNVNTEKFQSYISSLETTDKGLKHKCLSAFPPQIGSLSSPGLTVPYILKQKHNGSIKGRGARDFKVNCQRFDTLGQELSWHLSFESGSCCCCEHLLCEWHAARPLLNLKA